MTRTCDCTPLQDPAKGFKPVTNPGKDTVFGSQVARFKGTGPFTPGPGGWCGFVCALRHASMVCVLCVHMRVCRDVCVLYVGVARIRLVN